jgi:sugar lactone lactonase YvrE
MEQAPVLLDDLMFPERLRWHDGRLWFTDHLARTIVAVTEEGDSEVVHEVDGQPGGLDWLPDGRMIVASTHDRRLLRTDDGELAEVADLTDLTDFALNDMAVDATGRAYVGTVSLEGEPGGEPEGTTLLCVLPDGEAWIVIEDLLFPNGIAVAEEANALIVSESFAQRLSAYTIEADGSLSDPRVWADLRPNVPHGICLDARGAAWVADPVNQGLMRVVHGVGAVDWLPTGERGAYSCVLGGADGRTLFVATAESSNPERARELCSARIESFRVDVPAPGYDLERDPEAEPTLVSG